MFSADHLCGAPPYPEARGSAAGPVVIVSCNSEVAQIRRVILRASVYRALPLVDVACFRTVEYRSLLLVPVAAEGHNLVMRWAQRPKVVILLLLIGHGAGILYRYLEECKTADASLTRVKRFRTTERGGWDTLNAVRRSWVLHPFALLAKGASFYFSCIFFLHARLAGFSALPPAIHSIYRTYNFHLTGTVIMW